MLKGLKEDTEKVKKMMCEQNVNISKDRKQTKKIPKRNSGA